MRTRSIVLSLALAAPAAAQGAGCTCDELCKLLDRMNELTVMIDLYEDDLLQMRSRVECLLQPPSERDWCAFERHNQLLGEGHQSWLDSDEGAVGCCPGAQPTKKTSGNVMSTNMTTCDMDEGDYAKTHCDELVRPVRLHERLHVAQCKLLQRRGETDLAYTPELHSFLELMSYRLELSTLRDLADDLAARCSTKATCHPPESEAEKLLRDLMGRVVSALGRSP
jgi:hypothetical protein